MYENVKGYIKKLFGELDERVTSIVQTSPSFQAANQSIIKLVENRITSASQGYMIDLYCELSQKTLSEEIFQIPANANKFYELNMRQQINDSCKFDIQKSETYCTGIDFKEIDRNFVSVGAALGTAAVGGILLSALSVKIDIPMAVIAAGAVLTGAAGGGVTYAKIIPDKNKENYHKAVQNFMMKLENDLYIWIDEVAKFYNQKVDDLRATL